MENKYKQSLAQKVNSPRESASVPRESSQTVAQSRPAQKTGSGLKGALAVLALLLFVALGAAGVLISQQQYQDRARVAPTAPESEPAAFINQASCTLTFTVSEVTPSPTPTATPTPTPTPAPSECGYTPCSSDTDCSGSLVCILADDGESYCGEEQHRDRCAADPGVSTCCETEPTPTPTATVTPSPTPENTPTPVLQACGYSPCENNFDCVDDLICVTADDGNNYCARSEYRTACENNPSVTTCCEAPPTPTTPGENLTPTSTTVINVTSQPELPAELPTAGPEDWLTYLQIGLGTLGIGALLLLFL